MGSLGGEQLGEVAADLAGALDRDALAAAWPASVAAGPSRARNVARMLCSTPQAVTGDGSPDPPADSRTPVTQGVTWAIASMSAVEAPTSSAAR